MGDFCTPLSDRSFPSGSGARVGGFWELCAHFHFRVALCFRVAGRGTARSCLLLDLPAALFSLPIVSCPCLKVMAEKGCKPIPPHLQPVCIRDGPTSTVWAASDDRASPVMWLTQVCSFQLWQMVKKWACSCILRRAFWVPPLPGQDFWRLRFQTWHCWACFPKS